MEQGLNQKQSTPAAEEIAPTKPATCAINTDEFDQNLLSTNSFAATEAGATQTIPESWKDISLNDLAGILPIARRINDEKESARAIPSESEDILSPEIIFKTLKRTNEIDGSNVTLDDFTEAVAIYINSPEYREKKDKDKLERYRSNLRKSVLESDNTTLPSEKSIDTQIELTEQHRVLRNAFRKAYSVDNELDLMIGLLEVESKVNEDAKLRNSMTNKDGTLRYIPYSDRKVQIPHLLITKDEIFSWKFGLKELSQAPFIFALKKCSSLFHSIFASDKSTKPPFSDLTYCSPSPHLGTPDIGAVSACAASSDISISASISNQKHYDPKTRERLYKLEFTFTHKAFLEEK